MLEAEKNVGMKKGMSKIVFTNYSGYLSNKRII